MLPDDGQFTDDERRKIERLRAVHVGRKAATDAMPPFLSDNPHADLPTMPLPAVVPQPPAMSAPAERWAVVVERQAHRLAALRQMKPRLPRRLMWRIADTLHMLYVRH